MICSLWHEYVGVKEIISVWWESERNPVLTDGEGDKYITILLWSLSLTAPYSDQPLLTHCFLDNLKLKWLNMEREGESFIMCGSFVMEPPTTKTTWMPVHLCLEIPAQTLPIEGSS